MDLFTRTKTTADSTTRPTRRRRIAIAAATAGTLLGAAGLGIALSTAGPAGAATIPASFPNASTAGVPAGTSLTAVPGQVKSGPGWHWDSRGWLEVDGNGAVLSNLRVSANIDVTASNVTIKGVRLITGGGESMGISLRHTSDVTIENSTIAGTSTTTGRLEVGIKDVFGDSTGTQILDNNVYKCATGIQMAEGTIQGNYVHQPGALTTDHVGGVVSNGGTDPLTIDHNTILNNMGQTDAVALYQDFGVMGNATVNDNLLAGGSYALYAGGGSNGPSYNITVTDNQFSTMYHKLSGVYGPVTAWDSNGKGNVWSGNTWSPSGTVLRSP